jgi:ankyrin repeat protein
MTAARSGSLDTVKMLLAAGAAVDTPEGWRGQTALMWAALEKHPAVIKELIAAGAAVNAVSKGEGKFAALHFAARAGHHDAVEALLAAGADLNLRTGDGNTALHLALVNSHFDLALALIEKGADVRADGPGWTPLHQLLWTRRQSAGRGQPWRIPTGTRDTMAVARALVARGADVNAVTTKDPRDAERHFGSRVGTTPLLHAAKLADAPMMRYLIANGANPAATTPNGTTLLMWSAGIGIWIVGESAGTNEEALEAVKVALEQPGVDVNAVNADKDTALHGAAYRGANAIVQLLFEKGADLNAKNTKGWTALVIAEGVFYPNTYNRRPETADLLRTLGAQPSPPDVQRRVP